MTVNSFSTREQEYLLGVKIDTLSVDELLQKIDETIATDRKMTISYANIHSINLAQQQAWFRDFLNHSEITFCDGFGVKWAARLLGISLPYRYTVPDWFDRLAALCADRGYSLFFLGARPGIAQKSAELVLERFPLLEDIPAMHGYFDNSPGSAENEAVLQAINRFKPDILVLGLGMPLQERWVSENLSMLDVKTVLLAGALFDHYSKSVPRAPRWMTDHGMEWLGRLLAEPRRLWRRYLLGIPRFLWYILKQRIQQFISPAGD